MCSAALTTMVHWVLSGIVLIGGWVPSAVQHEHVGGDRPHSHSTHGSGHTHQHDDAGQSHTGGGKHCQHHKGGKDTHGDCPVLYKIVKTEAYAGKRNFESNEMVKALWPSMVERH
jgi:hypothetical protein